MFWKTKRPEKKPERRLRVSPVDSKPAPSQPSLSASPAFDGQSAEWRVLLALDFSAGSVAGLPGQMEEMLHAGPPGEAQDGAYAISAWQAACSKRVALVEQGSKVVFDFKVRAIVDSTNDEPLTFSAGPLFYNAVNEIIQPWSQQPALTQADGDRSVVIEMIAPPGAFTVRIGVHGPWAPDGNVSDGSVGLVSARILAA
jgi:hypothetical protein